MVRLQRCGNPSGQVCFCTSCSFHQLSSRCSLDLKESDLDLFRQHLEAAHPESPLVFSCQMGLGRSTVGEPCSRDCTDGLARGNRLKSSCPLARINQE